MQRQFVPTSLIPHLIGIATEEGVNLERVFARAGLDAELLADPDGVISTRQLDALIIALRDDVKDPAFGLHMGEHLRVDQLQIVGSLIATASTADQALNLFLRFKDLLHPYGRLIREDNDGVLGIIYSAEEEQAMSSQFHYAELYFSGIARIGRTLVGEDNIKILKVSFTHAEPDYASEYTRIFRAPVTFSDEQNAIWVDAAFLRLPLSGAFPSYNRSLEEKAVRRMAELPNELSITRRVVDYLEAQMGYAVASMDDAAARLNMTPRTLQRRLKAEGTTYAALRDEVRYRFARKYLKIPGMDMDSIAAALGFSEPANFFPAFRRWAGMSPGEYRRKQLGG